MQRALVRYTVVLGLVLTTWPFLLPASEHPGLSQIAAEIVAFQKSKGFPRHLLPPGSSKQPGDLDIHQYFDFFDHITLKEGYVLDWVYSSYEVGGSPTIYARRKSDEPFANINELILALDYEELSKQRKELKEAYDKQVEALAMSSPRKQELQGRYVEEMAALTLPNHFGKKWMQQIEMDGTDEGFLEAALLYHIGDLFYLRWHALYGELTVITCAQDLRNMMESPPPDLIAHEGNWPKALIELASRLDPDPWVYRYSNHVNVSFLTFSSSFGFQRKTISISSSPPHRVLKKKSITLGSWTPMFVF